MANDLIIELPKSNAIQVFTEPGGIDPYLQKIREEALSHVPDLSTKAGRAAIASIAAKVARSKTYLEDAGKQLCDAERAKIDATLSAVMASRKRIKEELDALRDEVRKPLTEWENAEAERKGRIETRIEAMRKLPEIGSDSALIEKHLKRLEKTEIDESFEEYTAEAALARTHAIRDCQQHLDNQLKIEREKTELEELRKKQEWQEKEKHEEEIAKQAADRARIEFEREAKAKLEADKKRSADENHRKVIINQAVESLETHGYDSGHAEEIINLIVENRIKNVTINF